MGGVTGLLVTGISSIGSFLISQDGAPRPGGFCTSGPGSGSGSDGIQETADALPLMEVVSHPLPSLLPAA